MMQCNSKDFDRFSMKYTVRVVEGAHDHYKMFELDFFVH